MRYPEGGRGAKPSSKARTSTRHVEITIVRQSTAATRHLLVITMAVIILYRYVVVVLPLVPGGFDTSIFVSFAENWKWMDGSIVTHSNGCVLRLKGGHLAHWKFADTCNVHVCLASAEFIIGATQVFLDLTIEASSPLTDSASSPDSVAVERQMTCRETE